MAKEKASKEESKCEAVQLVIEGEKSAYQVGRDIGVAQTTLSRWIRQHQEFGSPSASKRAEQEELERLRRENSQLTMERDFLRDAAACFAKQKA